MSKHTPEEWIVELESGVWLAKWAGDPGRTLVKQNARKYKTISSATIALGLARRFRPFPSAAIAKAEEAEHGI